MSLGSPGDLEELDETSSTAVPETSSDVSSAVARTMDGTKLGRVIEQLKGIMIESSLPSTTPDCKGDSALVVLSSDDEKEVEPTPRNPPSTSPAGSAMSIGEYLKHAKAKRLSKQTTKTDKPENPYVLPKSVS